MPHDHHAHDHNAHDHNAHADHGQGHHGHSHAPTSFGRAFAIGTAANAAFVVLQVVMGLRAGSMALVADALHNLGDVLGLLLAWGAGAMGHWRPTARHTYGWGRSSILAALANSMLLLLGCGAIAVEAVQRFGSPAPVGTGIVMAVAALGIVINGGTAMLFMRGRASDLNVRAAFQHMAADALVSAGVVAAGLAVALTGWLWLDPLASLGIVAVITLGTWGVLRQSVALALDAVPEGIERTAVRDALLGLPGVVEVHDLHIWALSTSRSALTAHLVADEPGDLAERACGVLRERFGIEHATVQVEVGEAAARCRLRSCDAG